MKWIWALAFLVVVVASNPEEGAIDQDVFEGDMILTPEQKAAALSGGDIDAPLGRAATKASLWPGGVVPYEIDSALARESKAKAAINGAFREWTSKTCIRFKKRTNEPGYIYFKPGFGCKSLVGRTGGRQGVVLDQGCWTAGVVAHEIGHALGFYHEQSRPDRDDYITIMWENMFDAYKSNFKKYKRGKIDSLGTPYDYGSLMHYGGKAFTKNGKPTIVPKKSGVTIGQRRGLSSIDARQMNLLYKGQCGGGGGGGGGGGEGSSCADKKKECTTWTSYCSYNQYVKANCKKTCKLCWTRLQHDGYQPAIQHVIL